MSLASISKIDILRHRAQMFRAVRTFFDKRKVMEVDVPMLSTTGPVDCHIDLVQATCCGKPSFLHSSPEYGMKRLLAQGCGDIYQLSHVFRDGEFGDRHNPEFTMVEWYRLGYSFDAMIQETIDLIHLFLPGASVEFLSYRDAFEKIGGKPYTQVQERDAFFAFEIEPHLGKEGLTVLTGFPPSEAMLSQVSFNGKEMVAERFEIFFHAMELANGYHELTDPQEQERRLIEANAKRHALGKSAYPIDRRFLESLRSGIPDCCGVAVGFDRLMMLMNEESEIHNVMALSWQEM